MDPTQPDAFTGLFTIAAVFIGLVFAVGVGITVYRSVRMANRGQNPLTLQEDVAAKVMQAPALQPARTKEQRLDELDSLRALGRISEEELRVARSRILSE